MGREEIFMATNLPDGGRLSRCEAVPGANETDGHRWLFAALGLRAACCRLGRRSLLRDLVDESSNASELASSSLVCRQRAA